MIESGLKLRYGFRRCPMNTYIFDEEIKQQSWQINDIGEIHTQWKYCTYKYIYIYVCMYMYMYMYIINGNTTHKINQHDTVHPAMIFGIPQSIGL